jgi:hypothetical protein
LKIKTAGLFFPFHGTAAIAVHWAAIAAPRSARAFSQNGLRDTKSTGRVPVKKMKSPASAQSR